MLRLSFLQPTYISTFSSFSPSPSPAPLFPSLPSPLTSSRPSSLRPSSLHKFKKILQRENLKSDLDDKFNTIFKNYGIELEQVQQLYERHSKVC